MTKIPKKLEWKRTSRNTEIAISNLQDHGKILFKKSTLINAQDLNRSIESFKTLYLITKKIGGVNSPKIIESLCYQNVLAIEFFSEKSFHEIWLKKDYSNERVLHDISRLYLLLEKFHYVTLDKSVGYPLSYCDFGPKNIIYTNKDIIFIDPPLEFKFKPAFYDLGTLMFEIDRSLMQASRLDMIKKNRKLAFKMANKKESLYKSYKTGFNSHFMSVINRYIKFYTKPRPLREFLRGLFIMPVLLGYYFLANLYDLKQKFFSKND